VLFFAESYSLAAEHRIVEKRGGKVKVVKYDDRTWQLLVGGKPYFIRGVVFNPVNIGQSPDEATQQDWMYEDDNHDGIIDIPYQTWIDKNKNNIRDNDEPLEGDFFLLKKMGVNTIRLYHLPSNNPLVRDIYKKNKNTMNLFDHAVNKKLLRDLYHKYGIRVIAGHFLGSWTVGAGVTWEEGVDYNNPKQRENIKNSVKAMVLDNKDEPYILMWLLGNENNIATWSGINAPQYPEAYASLVGEIADMIHKIDPNHIAYNAYRGMDGFGNLWHKSKEIFDRPIFISEFGQYAYSDKKGEDEEIQYRYFKNAWADIQGNSILNYWSDHQGEGNVIGGVIFHWIDQWYLNWKPFEHNAGSRVLVENQPLKHDEYWGILSLGNGADTLMRQKRKSYKFFTQIWNTNNNLR